MIPYDFCSTNTQFIPLPQRLLRGSISQHNGEVTKQPTIAVDTISTLFLPLKPEFDQDTRIFT